MTSKPDGIMPDQRKPGVLAARLLIGLIVLICAEVFSGASLQIGLWHLCLALLYGVSYFKLRPEGLPSVRVQLLTLVIYALVILCLRLHSPREPLPVNVVDVEPRELELAMAVFAWVIGLGFVFSFVARQPLIFVPFVLNSVIWTFLGFLLTAIALWQGVRELRNPRAGSHGLDKENRGSREIQPGMLQSCGCRMFSFLSD